MSAPVTAGTVLSTLLVGIAARNPERTRTLNHINLRMAELAARKDFHQDPTPETLTAWCDANELLEES